MYEGEASADEPYIYRGYADGCTELVFHYRGPFDLITSRTGGSNHRLPRSSCTKPYIFTLDRKKRLVDLWLLSLPIRDPAFVRFPANDLTNLMTDFRSLLGVEGGLLEEQIMTAQDNAERVAMLSAFLERRLDHDLRDLPPVFTSINRIIQTAG